MVGFNDADIIKRKIIMALAEAGEIGLDEGELVEHTGIRPLYLHPQLERLIDAGQVNYGPAYGWVISPTAVIV